MIDRNRAAVRQYPGLRGYRVPGHLLTQALHWSEKARIQPCGFVDEKGRLSMSVTHRREPDARAALSGDENTVLPYFAQASVSRYGDVSSRPRPARVRRRHCILVRAGKSATLFTATPSA